MVCKYLPAHSNSSFAFGNFLDFFSPNIFVLQLVESADEEPKHNRELMVYNIVVLTIVTRGTLRCPELIHLITAGWYPLTS